MFAASSPLLWAFLLAWYLQPTWKPAVCVAVLFLLWHVIGSMAFYKIANSHQTDVIDEFLDGRKFEVHFTELPENLKREADALQEIKSLACRKLGFKTYWVNESLVILIGKPLGGKLLGQAKAFLNPFGTHVLIVDRPVEHMDDYGKFILYHEFGHITFEGERQLQRAHSERRWRVMTLMSLLFWINFWWQWPIVLAYASYIVLAWYTSVAFNEGMADNHALLRFESRATQLKLVTDLRELLEAGVMNSSLIKRLMAVGRLIVVKRTEEKLKTNTPLLRLSSKNGSFIFSDLVFALLFLTWPLTSPTVPLSVLAFMVIYLLRGAVIGQRDMAFWEHAQAHLQEKLSHLPRPTSNPSRSTSSASSP